jgi:hypothetical protein
MRITIFWIFCITSIHLLLSQNKYDYTWTFGTNIGSNKYINRINFSDSGIIKIDSLLSTFDILGDKTSICNGDGKQIVLFTNCSILDNDLDTIKGNYSLKTNRRNYWCFDPINYYYPFNQSMLILSDTHKKNIYPILLMDIASIERDQDSLKSLFYGILYSMNLDLKNILNQHLENNWNQVHYDTFAPGHLSACLQDNSKDWWIIVPLDASTCYLIYEYTSTGLNIVGRTCVGNKIYGELDFVCTTTFSPDRTKYARYCPRYGVQLFDFDSKTGAINRPKYFHEEEGRQPYGGICFSPDSKLLYVFSIDSIYQYDLTSGNIESSGILIDTLNRSTGKTNISAFNSGRIGPDGRIYIGGFRSGQYLNVINNPNCRGKKCELIQQAVRLPGNNDFTLAYAPYFYDFKGVRECKETNSGDSKEENLNVFDKRGDFIFYNFKDKSGWISIYSINGKLIKTMKNVSPSGVISIEDFTPGAYLIQANWGTFHYEYKLVKN